MRDCLAVRPGLALEQLVNEYILGSGRRCFPVLEDKRIVGLITLHNVQQAPRDLWPMRTVEEEMTPLDKLKWVRPDEDLSIVLQLMSTEDISQLPVIDEGNIVGMVARENILAFINNHRYSRN